MATERLPGPTPNGGAYAERVWMNLDLWIAVPKSEATGVVVTEYTEDGKLIMESIATVGPQEQVA